MALPKVKGTGPKPQILREDVEAFAKAQLLNATPRPTFLTTAGPTMGLPHWPKEDFEKFGPVERQKLSRIVKISGPALTRNALVVPHVCNFDTADVNDFEEFRNVLNAEAGPEDAMITLSAFTVKALVAAQKAFRTFNSSLDGVEFVLERCRNISVVADTPEGLVVPVVKASGSKSVAEIAPEIGAQSAQARVGKLSPAAMSGATFAISSLGGFAGTGSPRSSTRRRLPSSA